MQPTVSAKVTVADGSEIEVPMNFAPPEVTDGVVTIKAFQFAPFDMGPDKPKAITFTFVAKFAEGAAPKSLEIDDFTEDPILRIFTDTGAHIVKEHLYGQMSQPYAPQDEHVKWILTLDNSIRVYRFTFKMADGSTHVLLKPIMVPALMKNYIRSQLGLKV